MRVWFDDNDYDSEQTGKKAWRKEELSSRALDTVGI